MKRFAIVTLFLFAMLCVITGCRQKDGSPRIVVDMEGKMKSTAFSFAGFREALEAEHGAVEADAMNSLKTRSVEVYFRELENGTLLAEQVYLVESRDTMEPAVLFGLRDAPAEAGE